MDTNLANPKIDLGIIRIKKIQITDWQKKVTPKIEKLAEILLKTGGRSSRPPLLRQPNHTESYEPTNENDLILIAAKLAETKGLKKMWAWIDNELIEDLLEMEVLLNESEAKPEPEVTLEPQPKPETKATTKLDELERTVKLMDTLKKVNYRELQKKLKVYRKEGKTNIKLNRSKATLYLELLRIEGK